MTQPPAELTYGTIKWWVAGMVADTTADINDLPELRSVNGRAFVTPDVESDGLFLQELTTPLTLLKIEAELLIVEGRLQDKAGHDFAKLLANDSPGLSQTGWSYTLRFELDDGLTFGEFSFYLTTGEVLDLTMVVPLGTPSAGVVITKGQKGDQGIQGEAATVTIGTVTTLAAGSSATVENVGTDTDAILNLGLPRGLDGLGSVVSINGQAPDEDGDVNLGTSSNTPNAIARRDVDGGAIFGWLQTTLPAVAPADVPNKSYVDGLGTAAAEASSIVRRDTNARSQFQAVTVQNPTNGGTADTLARKDYVDALGSSAAGSNTVMRRDVNGESTLDQMWIADPVPTNVGHATRKDYVDGLGTSANTPDTIVRRNGTGGVDFSQVWASGAQPPESHALTRRDYVDAAIASRVPVPGVDPNADRLLFWDDSAGAWAYLTLGTGLSITGTTINGTAAPAAASESASGIVELATRAEALLAASTSLAVTPDDLAGVPVVVRSAGAAPNRPATPRPVHWILPTASALPLTGTVAGGTAAAVDGLDIISRYS